MFMPFKWYLSFSRYMGAVYTANLNVLHVTTRKSTNPEPPHYVIISITLPVPPPPQHHQFQTNFCTNTKPREIRNFVYFITGLYTQLHKTGAMFFYGVTQSAFQGHNPSLIQAPLPALNPFRWILKYLASRRLNIQAGHKKRPPLFMRSTCPPYKLCSQYNPCSWHRAGAAQVSRCVPSSFSHLLRRVTVHMVRYTECAGARGWVWVASFRICPFLT